MTEPRPAPQEAPRPVEITPLMVDAAGLAGLLLLSERQVARLDAGGKIPAPIRFGRRTKRWNVEEAKAWIAAGAPPRSRWAAMWRAGK